MAGAAFLFAGCSGNGLQSQPTLTVANPGAVRSPSLLAQPSATVTKIASIPFPKGIAIGTLQNIYVAQPRSNKITRINADGSTTTIGSGFKHPEGVAVRRRYVYVADTGNAAVKRVAPNGNIKSIAPGAWGGPNALAVASTGDLYVTDHYNAATVSQVSRNGTITPVLTQQDCADPTGVAVDASLNVFVACNSNDEVLKVTPDGTITQIGPSFSDLLAITVDKLGNVVITTDRHGNYEIAPDGHSFPIGGGFNFGISYGVDTRGDALYVSSYNHGAIYKVTP